MTMVTAKEIYKAREGLRRIHKEYTSELYDIMLKIDQDLEVLQNAKMGAEDEAREDLL